MMFSHIEEYHNNHFRVHLYSHFRISVDCKATANSEIAPEGTLRAQ